MGEQELYKKYAGYYDLIYNWMDYPGEADFIKRAITHHKNRQVMNFWMWLAEQEAMPNTFRMTFKSWE